VISVRLAIAFLAVLCVLYLCSCCGETTVPPLLLSAADFGTTRDARVGQSISLSLDENPSTGFTWKRFWTPAAPLTLTQDTFTPGSGGGVGVGGTRLFVWEAVRPGVVVITLQLARGSETEPAQTITLNITN
jgi:inhibitor of cysteine peptidase